MSRHPPSEPATTVVVVSSNELVPTSTPGAISLSPLTRPVYQRRMPQTRPRARPQTRPSGVTPMRVSMRDSSVSPDASPDKSQSR